MTPDADAHARFFPQRAIHLDFHTGPDVPDVGSRFDGSVFARTLVDAGVDSVTLFAKCHHGLLYYGTDRPERHPGLAAGLDLLEEQVASLHAVGIRTPIYLSVQCDEFAANAHPDWVVRDEDLRQLKLGGSAYAAGWQILDMSSPYQDHLAEQIQEVADRFAPLDGLFLDMCWDQPSSSAWAIRGMLDRGLDPESAGDRTQYAAHVSHAYMARFADLVTPHLAADVESGIWFNSRPKSTLAQEGSPVRHVEIESLPTGGWGYTYFPYVARTVRSGGLPVISMTGRFHKGWGDNGGLKPRAALLYETSQAVSQNASISVGDLLHPSGELDPTTYRLIGDAFRHARACSELTRGATVVTEIALLAAPAPDDRPHPSVLGAVRGLQQLRHQFDILAPEADFGRYRLVVVPESTAIDPGLDDRLDRYLASGGSVLVVRDEHSATSVDGVLARIVAAPPTRSPYSHVFLRPADALGIADGFDHVMYERTLRLQLSETASTLCGVVEPYFERSWRSFSGHEYTPAARRDEVRPVIAQSGRAILVGMPLLSAIANHAETSYRALLGALIERLLPEPLVSAGGPVHLETSVMRGPRSTLVHLTSFLPTRVASSSDPVITRSEGLDLVEDPFPLVDVPVRVRLRTAPTRARLEPVGRDLAFDWDGTYLSAAITVLDGHAVLVIDEPAP